MKIATAIFGMLVTILAIGLLMSWPASMLWNQCLVPAVTGLKEVGIFQMWGINILASIVFKGVEVTTK